MVVDFISHEKELKYTFEREFVDRFYTRDLQQIPAVSHLEFNIKLYPTALKSRSLSEVVRYLALVEVITGQKPAVYIKRTSRRSWVEIRCTVRTKAYVLLTLLLNQLWTINKLKKQYVSFQKTKDVCVLSIHNLLFFDFLGKYRVVDDKLLAHWDVLIHLKNEWAGGDKLQFLLNSCIKSY